MADCLWVSFENQNYKKKNIYHPPATTNNNQPSGYQPVQGNKEILTLNHAKWDFQNLIQFYQSIKNMGHEIKRS